jgi:DNA-binding TFAR19-related protein (PDSD5 family)
MPADRSHMARRAIILQVLRDDHPERWTRAELERQLPDFLPEEVEAAVEDLAAEGVLSINDDDETVSASLCARKLDALELVSI